MVEDKPGLERLLQANARQEAGFKRQEKSRAKRERAGIDFGDEAEGSQPAISHIDLSQEGKLGAEIAAQVARLKANKKNK